MPSNKLPIVLITHALPDNWINMLEGKCRYFAGEVDSIKWEPGLKALLPEAEGILSLLTIPVSKEILNQAPKLRVVSNMAVGVDNIDVPACTIRGIPVGNTPGVLTESTADLAMALLLSIARNIPQASLDARKGLWKTWAPVGWLGIELAGATLGIIGMGKIGQAVAKRAQGFGMTILFTDTERKSFLNAYQVNLDELLESSDIVSLHAPLVSETRGIISSWAFSQIKSSAILINTARGQLVDTAALITALQENKISGAALDVTDPEPLPPNHPLYTFPNCLIVPHIGSATQHTRRLMAELACKNLLAGLSGERIPNCVNPEVYLFKE
jgi:phosphoglycerate dehydrogenase-like enzyme